MEMLAAVLKLWDSVAGRAVSSIILAALAYVLLTFIIPLVTRRTRHEIDDIIVGVLRLPLPIIVLLSILATTVPLSNLPEGSVYIVTRVIVVLLIISITYVLLKLFSQVVTRYAEEYAKQTETNLDDILVPLLTRRIIPLSLVLVMVITILWAIGINLGGVLAGLGALSFLLIFLFQEPLSNLFGGVYLVIDVPFKYGDLIILEDEKTYRVEEIGARVTRLYDTNNHTVAYVPNKRLAGERLINLTRPNVELRMKIEIGVAYGTESLTRVQEILVEAANAHPHVLGDIDAKLEAIKARLRNTPNANARIRLSMEMDRLRVENSIRELCERVIRDLKSLSDLAHHLEEGGLDRREREVIQAILTTIWHVVGDMRRKLTIWLHLVARLDATYKLAGPITGLSEAEISVLLPSIDQLELWREGADKPDEIKSQLSRSGNLAVIGTFADADEEFYLTRSASWVKSSKHMESQEIRNSMNNRVEDWMREMPAWGTFNDYRILYRVWHKPVRDLLRRLEACSDIIRLHGAKEFLLHKELEKVMVLLEEKFLLQTPGWQQPDADLVGFGEFRIDFRLEFFVDDLGREHFQRVDDVFSEVSLDIIERLKAEHIEVPSPQTGVWFRDEWLKDTLRKLRE